MDAKKKFKELQSRLKKDFPTETFFFEESQIKEFETFITPSILKVIQRDETLFKQPFLLFQRDISSFLSSNYWELLQACTFSSFLSGDIKEKVFKLLENFKGLWEDSSTEIEKILGTEESRTKVSEILEFIMTTKLAKIVISLVETINISELGIDFENPEEVLKSFQDPSNKIMETVSRKIKHELELRLKRGDFTKEQLIQDIERIKVKVQLAFGSFFNEMLGIESRKGNVSSEQILGNSPEARRARMIARLKRKLEERKTSQ